MPIYDVTITRTGCVMVEADNENEAMHLAANLPTESVSWTDDWEASDANEIAANAEEFGEDMKLVHTDPFIKVKILANDNGWHCSQPVDGKMCIFAAPNTPAEKKSVAITQALIDAGFGTKVSWAEVENENTLLYNGKKYTPAALCGYLNIAPHKVYCLPGAMIITASLPVEQAVDAQDPYKGVFAILDKYEYMHEKIDDGTVEATPGWSHKGNGPKVIEELKAIGCTVLQEPRGGLIICLCQK